MLSPEFFTELPAKIRVILSNMLTYLMLAQTAITWVIANGTFDGIPEIGGYLVIALTWLSAIITFIRRVTPVVEEERGLLPQSENKAQWVGAEAQ